MSQEALEFMKEQQISGCLFVVTWGDYEDYSIQGAFGGWMQALEHLKITHLQDSIIEVWKHDVHVGNWIPCIAKSEWDVLGKRHIENGVRWEPA